MSEKGRKIYNGITNIDDDLIMAALAAKPQAMAPVKKKKSKMYYVYRWGAAAAAVICLAVVGIVLFPVLSNKGSSDSATSYAPMSDSTNSVAESTSSIKGDGNYNGYSDTDAACDTEVADMDEATATEDTNSDEVSADSEYVTIISSFEDTATGAQVNQVTVDLEPDDVEKVTIQYPGKEPIVVDEVYVNIVANIVGDMGVLTKTEYSADVIDEDCAKITMKMSDGSELDIVPNYPYISINGVVYECDQENKAIEKLAVYINELLSIYYQQGE